ncbi:hypothetical protein [Acidovorax sp. Leaf160]|uniref:hypothetical protein n=1 Tax=Acidovorax sp. Leaf160 TaxID=1736280 RepID=UPI000B2F1E3A|nr:hypothetical protein [Acidovorax sp. Leaf160]
MNETAMPARTAPQNHTAAASPMLAKARALAAPRAVMGRLGATRSGAPDATVPPADRRLVHPHPLPARAVPWPASSRYSSISAQRP